MLYLPLMNIKQARVSQVFRVRNSITVSGHKFPIVEENCPDLAVSVCGTTTEHQPCLSSMIRTRGGKEILPLS